MLDDGKGELVLAFAVRVIAHDDVVAGFDVTLEQALAQLVLDTALQQAAQVYPWPEAWFKPGELGGSWVLGVEEMDGGDNLLRVVLPADLPPGQYYIEVGLYEMVGKRRLHMADPAGNLIGDRLILGPVDVSE